MRKDMLIDTNTPQLLDSSPDHFSITFKNSNLQFECGEYEAFSMCSRGSRRAPFHIKNFLFSDKGLISCRVFNLPFLHPSPHLHCISSVSSGICSCPALRNPMDCSTPGFPVCHQLLELAQTHVH